MKWAQLLLFGTIGLVLLIKGTIDVLNVYPIIHNNVATEGTITALNNGSVGNSSDTAAPVIEFSTRDNNKIRFNARTGSTNESEYEIGNAVKVLYDPRDPSSARLGSAQQLLQGPLTEVVIGLIVLFLSLLLFKKIGNFEKALNAIGSNKKRERT